MEGRKFPVSEHHVRIALLIGRDFRAIALVQHLLGLATGGHSCWPPGVASWEGVAAHAIATLALRRHGARNAGGLSFLAATGAVRVYGSPGCPLGSFFAVLDFFWLVRFLLAWKIDRNSHAAFAFGAAALFVSFVLPSLKPSFWLTTVLTTAPVWWWIFFERRERWSRRLLMAALPVGAAYLLLLLPEKILLRSDTQSTSFLPESIFSIHALIIREQIVADIAAPDPNVPYSTEALRSIPGFPRCHGIASARLPIIPRK